MSGFAKSMLKKLADGLLWPFKARLNKPRSKKARSKLAVDHFTEVKSIFKEMALGFLWPINAPLEWAVGHISNWRAKDWIKAVEVSAVVIAVFVLVVHFQIDRPKDRAVRVASLYTQMAQLSALPDKEALRGLRPAVLTLISEGISASNQNLASLDLSRADLSMAVFNQTDLSHANLLGANFSGADLDGAVFSEANISGADFTGAMNLEQSQIDKACITKGGLPPNLPDRFVPPSKVCSPGKTDIFHRVMAFATNRQYDRMIQDYDKAIRLKPQHALAYNNLAWLLSTASSEEIWDGDRAVTLAQRAVRLEKRANHFGTLAAAYARTGRFADAVEAQERAIAKLRTDHSPEDVVADFRSRLSLYRAGKAYKEEAKR